MTSIEDILDILDRAHTGPICTEKNWETKIVPTKISEKLKEHGLKDACDSENPVNTDDGLADEFWRAGFELAADIGMLCADTERVIKFTEEELREVLRKTPSEVTLGKGKDKVTFRHRLPESKIKPIYESPIGVPVSEELWVPLMTAIISIPIIDATEGFWLDTVFGRTVKPGTPYETLVGRVQAQMSREAAWRAGRPGICFEAVITSPTEFGQLGGFGVPGGFDPKKDRVFLDTLPPIKTNYKCLHKAVHAFNCNANILAAGWELIGGYVGPAEGCALAIITRNILNIATYLSTLGGVSPQDMRYMGNCGRDAQWACGVELQAFSRNYQGLTGNAQLAMQVSGPCTDMLLYESAVAMTNFSASGTYESSGPFPRGARHKDYITPVECKFNAEVLKAFAGMKRSEANDLAKVLIPKYEGRLKNPPEGKSVNECYDLKSRKPSKEWRDIYLGVKKELIDLGVPLEYP
jgi:methylamine--corrinoid protein Co-methyltransferase